MDTPRGRWKYDEASDTFQEVPRPAPKPSPEDVKEREKDERDSHPGNYL